MQRSQSMRLVNDEQLAALISCSPPHNTSPPRINGSAIHRSASMVAIDCLPKYQEAEHHDNKKETKFRPEQTVHLIPLILLLCAILLWIGSSSELQINEEPIRTTTGIQSELSRGNEELTSSRPHNGAAIKQQISLSTSAAHPGFKRHALIRSEVLKGAQSSRLLIRGQQ